MIRMNEMTWMEFKAKIDEGAITILPKDWRSVLAVW